MFMGKELYNKTPIQHSDCEPYNASFLSFDLHTLIENMKHARTWEKGELNAMILLKSPSRQILLTLLHKGTEIRSFQANDSITFQVLEGKLELHLRKESVFLVKDELLTLNDKLKYRLNSIEDTAFLLTLVSGVS
jgi:hypothetical protein